MSSTENYDGLCGIICRYSRSDKQVRCNYEFAHPGPCSFEKKMDQIAITIQSYCGPYKPTHEEIQERGFIDSVVFHNDSEK